MDVAAKLGIIVDANGARREISLTSEQLKALANRGTESTAAMKGLTAEFKQQEVAANRVRAAISRMRQASAAQKGLDLGLSQQIQLLDPFQLRIDRSTKAIERVAPVARAGRLSLGRLGNQFAGLAGAIGGVHPVVGNILGVMGNFAIGNPWTVGIMAGIAAIAVMWDRLTDSTRKAEKASRDARASLAERIQREALGPEPELQGQLSAERNFLRQQQERRRQLTKFGVKADDKRILDLNREISNSQALLIQGEKALEKARLAAGSPLKDVVIDSRDFKKEQEEIDRLQNDINKGVASLRMNWQLAELAIVKASLGIKQQVSDATVLRDAAILGKDAYEAANDAIEVRNALEAAGISIFDARYEAAKRDLELVMRVRRETEAKIAADKQAADDVVSAQKRAADQQERIVENLTRSMQENFSTFFVDTFNQGFSSFRKLFGNVRDLYFKMIADILAAKVMDKIGGALGLGTPSTVMNTAATKQVAASAVMLNASGAMVVAANIMASASGVPGIGGGAAGGVGGAATGRGAFGMGWGRAAGAGAAGGLIGYQIGSMTTNRGLGALGGAAGGAPAGFAVGGPVGAAIGGIAGFVGGILGSGKAAKEAAREMRRLQESLKLTMEAFRAQVRGDELGVAIAGARANLVELLKQINAALPGTRNETERNRQRAEAQRLEAQQEAQLREEYARKQLDAQDDLQTRLLRAQGKNDEAYARQQARERADLIRSFGGEIDATEAATLALLDQVLAQEKLTQASDAATKSALNMVSGYKLQATVFGAMAPRSSVPGSSAMMPGMPTPIGSQGGDLTVPVILDGQVIAKAVLTNFKSKAQKKFGDSSRWSEIQS